MMKSPNRRDFSAVLVAGLATLAAHPLCAQTSEDGVTQMEPTWESMAASYQAPQWFVDGKIGIWTHWGVPSAVDENRPNDGSHYGRRMYGPNEGETGAQLAITQTLSDWHVERYGDPSEFGYEDLVPLFKAQKWDPDALVTFFKDNRARFIMPVACHHDSFDMCDSSHPWNAVDIRFTTKDAVLYAFVLAPPTEDIVIKTLATGGLLGREIAGIELMGSSEEVRWNRSSDALTIQLPQTSPGKIVNGFRIITSNDN